MKRKPRKVTTALRSVDHAASKQIPESQPSTRMWLSPSLVPNGVDGPDHPDVIPHQMLLLCYKNTHGCISLIDPDLTIGRIHLHFFRVGLQSKEMPTATLIITVDLECCRCSSKIQKILCCIQQEGEFVIEKIVYEKDKVLVSGPFDANKLCCKLWCKAGRIIKNIEVAKPPPPKHEPSKPEPKPPKPDPPPCKCKLIYPYPYPFPCPQPGAWPCSCTKPQCGCQPKPPPEPPAPQPPPPPPKPPACQCPTWPSCYCSGYPPYLPPTTMPPYPMLVCDDSPPYGACIVM